MYYNFYSINNPRYQKVKEEKTLNVRGPIPRFDRFFQSTPPTVQNFFSLLTFQFPFFLFFLYIFFCFDKNTMSDSVLETLTKLSISPKVVSHAPVSDAKAWAEALKTEDASSFELTKTLILKPKTAKTAPVTPVVVIALESSETNATAIGKKLSLKDCRFANEDLLTGTFKTTKENVSPFSLSNVEDLSLVHLVLDAALPETTPLAFHPNDAAKTVFITVAQLKSYLESIKKEFVELDFKALAAAKPTGEKPAAKAPKAKKEGKREILYFAYNDAWEK